MSEESEDPAGSTQQFRAYARAGQAAGGPTFWERPRNRALIIAGVLAGAAALALGLLLVLAG